MEMDDKTQARLEKMVATKRLRLVMEMDEERRGRLENDAATKRLRFAMEMDNETQTRLEKMVATKRLRLAMETDEERRCVAALMQQRCDLDERLPLHEQHHVQAAMHSFHAEMSSVQIPTCSTCMETFPGMKINSRTSECLQCTRDRRDPKLYSSSNNMHPGAVPTELQVRL